MRPFGWWYCVSVHYLHLILHICCCYDWYLSRPRMKIFPSLASAWIPLYSTLWAWYIKLSIFNWAENWPKNQKSVVIFFYSRPLSAQNSAAKVKNFNKFNKSFVEVDKNFMRAFFASIDKSSLKSFFSSIGTLFENNDSVPCRF